MQSSFEAIIFTGGNENCDNHSGALETVLFRPAAEWVFCAVSKAGAKQVVFTTALADVPSAEGVSVRAGVSDLAAFAASCGEHLLLVCGETPLLTARTIRRAQELHIKNGYDLTAVKTERTRTAAVWCKRDCFIKAVEMYGEVSPHSLFKSRGLRCAVCFPGDQSELLRITDKTTLLEVSNKARERTLIAALEAGVEVTDAAGVSIAADAVIGAGTVIQKGTIIKPGCKIGANCVLGPDTVLDHATIGDGVTVNSSQIEYSEVGEGTTIGPMSHIRPNSKLGPRVKIGNFVEVKNSTLGEKTSVAHLTYIGDTDCGARVNWGCGCVTVNYDGKKKYRTTVGDDVFVGCNTNLVSPVTVEDHSYIAAGSTITDTVPGDALAIARARQVNKEGWNQNREEK